MPRLAAAALLLALSGCGPASAPAPAPTPTPQSLRQALEGARIETGVPGALAAIVRDGIVLFDGAAGEAVRSPTRAMRNTSLMPLMGVTEMVTASLVMRLAEEGRLTLDDPISKYLPYVPSAEEITLRILLAHRSGWTDYRTVDTFPGLLADPSHVFRREEVLSGVRQYFPADSAYRYTDSDYVALGAAIEQASGGSVGALYRRQIGEPLGIDRCLFDFDPALAPDVAHGFSYSSYDSAPPAQYSDTFPADGRVPASLWGPLWTDHGLACSAREAARFTDALLRGQLLRPETLASMTGFESPINYGLGVARKTDGPHPLQGHAGAGAGYTTASWYDPERHLTIVALVNGDGPDFVAGTIFQRMDEAYTRGARP